MLRYEYLPSDFNPKFLILGEHEDFASLSVVLREFSASPATIDVSKWIAGAKGPALYIIEATDWHGLRVENSCYAWHMNSYQAEIIAGRVDALASMETINGSDLLELGGLNEIPVAVSLGEFPDTYLHTRGP